MAISTGRAAITTDCGIARWPLARLKVFRVDVTSDWCRVVLDVGWLTRRVRIG